MRITDYKIISTDYRTDLEELVMDALIDGWQLLGGVSICAARGVGYIYAQAMVRYQ